MAKTRNEDLNFCAMYCCTSCDGKFPSEELLCEHARRCTSFVPDTSWIKQECEEDSSQMPPEPKASQPCETFQQTPCHDVSANSKDSTLVVKTENTDNDFGTPQVSQSQYSDAAKQKSASQILNDLFEKQLSKVYDADVQQNTFTGTSFVPNTSWIKQEHEDNSSEVPAEPKASQPCETFQQTPCHDASVNSKDSTFVIKTENTDNDFVTGTSQVSASQYSDAAKQKSASQILKDRFEKQRRKVYDADLEKNTFTDRTAHALDQSFESTISEVPTGAPIASTDWSDINNSVKSSSQDAFGKSQQILEKFYAQGLSASKKTSLQSEEALQATKFSSFPFTQEKNDDPSLPKIERVYYTSVPTKEETAIIRKVVSKARKSRKTKPICRNTEVKVSLCGKSRTLCTTTHVKIKPKPDQTKLASDSNPTREKLPTGSFFPSPPNLFGSGVVQDKQQRPPSVMAVLPPIQAPTLPVASTPNVLIASPSTFPPPQTVSAFPTSFPLLMPTVPPRGNTVILLPPPGVGSAVAAPKVIAEQSLHSPVKQTGTKINDAKLHGGVSSAPNLLQQPTLILPPTGNMLSSGLSSGNALTHIVSSGNVPNTIGFQGATAGNQMMTIIPQNTGIVGKQMAGFAAPGTIPFNPSGVVPVSTLDIVPASAPGISMVSSGTVRGNPLGIVPVSASDIISLNAPGVSVSVTKTRSISTPASFCFAATGSVGSQVPVNSVGNLNAVSLVQFPLPTSDAEKLGANISVGTGVPAGKRSVGFDSGLSKTNCLQGSVATANMVKKGIQSTPPEVPSQNLNVPFSRALSSQLDATVPLPNIKTNRKRKTRGQIQKVKKLSQVQASRHSDGKNHDMEMTARKTTQPCWQEKAVTITGRSDTLVEEKSDEMVYDMRRKNLARLQMKVIRVQNLNSKRKSATDKDRDVKASEVKTTVCKELHMQSQQSALAKLLQRQSYSVQTISQKLETSAMASYVRKRKIAPEHKMLAPSKEREEKYLSYLRKNMPILPKGGFVSGKDRLLHAEMNLSSGCAPVAQLNTKMEDTPWLNKQDPDPRFHGRISDLCDSNSVLLPMPGVILKTPRLTINAETAVVRHALNAFVKVRKLQLTPEQFREMQKQKSRTVHMPFSGKPWLFRSDEKTDEPAPKRKRGRPRRYALPDKELILKKEKERSLKERCGGCRPTCVHQGWGHACKLAQDLKEPEKEKKVEKGKERSNENEAGETCAHLPVRGRPRKRVSNSRKSMGTQEKRNGKKNNEDTRDYNVRRSLRIFFKPRSDHFVPENEDIRELLQEINTVDRDEAVGQLIQDSDTKDMAFSETNKDSSQSSKLPGKHNGFDANVEQDDTLHTLKSEKNIDTAKSDFDASAFPGAGSDSFFDVPGDIHSQESILQKYELKFEAVPGNDGAQAQDDNSDSDNDGVTGVSVGQKVYSCTVCHSFKCRSQDGIIGHLMMHEKGLLTCLTCSFNAATKRQLQEHIAQEHTRVPLYSCQACKKDFFSYSVFKQHVKSHEMQSSCIPCKQYFRNEKELERHKEKVHKIVLSRCKTCGKRFPGSELRSHEKECHRSFICCVCEAAWASVSQLKLHVQRAHKKRVLVCLSCNDSFLTRIKFNKHKETCMM